VLVVLLAQLSVSLSTSAGAVHRERLAAVERAKLRYEAEGVVNQAYATLIARGKAAYRAAATARETVLGVARVRSITYGDASQTVADDLVVIDGVAGRADVSEAVRCVLRFTPTPPSPLVFGDRGITLRSNSFVDSYDSAAGTYASQATSSWMGMPRADDDSGVATNGSMDLDGSTAVFGDARAGPAGTLRVTGNSIVTGTRGNLTQAQTLPPVQVPTIARVREYRLDSDQTGQRPPGNYHYDSLQLLSNARLTVRGPAVLVIGNGFIDSNAQLLCDVSGGPVEIYLVGPLRVMSNAVIRPSSGRPQDLWIRSSSAEEIYLDSNPQITARVYAPRARVTMLSNAQVFGSLVAGDLYLDSNAKVHMDETLNASTTAAHVVTPIAWQPLAPAAAQALLDSVR
jgi:hypothetical protein